MVRRPLVLASSSRYRQALLERLRLPYAAMSPDIDETPRPGETADALTLRLAHAKAAALCARFPAHLLIGSDQSATVDGRLIGKPGSRAAAIAQLAAAANHCVVFQTAVCVLDSATGVHRSRLVPTTVEFRDLCAGRIATYVDSEPAFDCAGAFKAEALGIALCRRITSDDPTALIGLPLVALIDLLETFGVSPLGAPAGHEAE